MLYSSLQLTPEDSENTYSNKTDTNLTTLLNNVTNSFRADEFSCQLIENLHTTYRVFTYFDLALGTVIPFFLMLTCSVYLIQTIFHSRKRLNLSNCQQERGRLRKDIRFSVVTVLLNVLFIVFHLPLRVYFITCVDQEKHRLVHDITWTLYGIGFATNFFVYLIANAAFRDEFLIMVRMRQQRSAKYTG